MTERSKRKSAVAGKIRSRNITLAVFAVLTLVLVCLFTPVFSINDIYVTGNSVLKTEDVIAASGIKNGDNLFRMNTKKAEEKINALGYVEKVEVRRKFLADVEIKITESKESCYVSFSGNYVGMNNEFKILSIRRSGKFTPKKAVISGMALKDVKKGTYAVAKKEEKLELAKLLVKELTKGELLTSVTKINIADAKEITLTMNTETVIILGDESQLDYKVKCIVAILEKLGEIRGGKINASDPANVIYEGGN